MLQKNDPIYYRDKLNKLFDGAIKEGLEVEIEVDIGNNTVNIYFKASNGDTAGIHLRKEI